jgi:excinuclease ABC subunit C
LACEFAARVQAEIEALNWVSCPQRVTTVDAANLTISGWSRGELVQFLIRDGRLCGWSQRSCGLTSVTQALSATPAAGRVFTQRNARTSRQHGAASVATGSWHRVRCDQEPVK